MALSFLQRFVPLYSDNLHLLTMKFAQFLSTGLGLGGVVYLSAGNTATGVFNVVHAIEDCVFTAITYEPGTTTGTLVGHTLLAGDRSYGHYRSLTLGSGFAELSRSSQPHSS
jgi:hypothetical protein